MKWDGGRNADARHSLRADPCDRDLFAQQKGSEVSDIVADSPKPDGPWSGENRGKASCILASP